MRRIRNLSRFNDEIISHCRRFFEVQESDAIAVNARKAQFVFDTIFESSHWIVKRYEHHTLQHRLASFLNQANADRYARIANLFERNKIKVPRPLLILKRGRGLLPDQTLLVMEWIEGTMLRDLLPELEHDPKRTENLADTISRIIGNLRELGFFHRDLNAKNLLVTDENTITLINFDYAGYSTHLSSNFIRRHRRDIETLLASCKDAPNFTRAISERLTKTVCAKP